MVYQLVNQNGVTVRLDTLGASVRRVVLPDRKGTFQNVALEGAFSSDKPSQCAYAGATLGPCTGRIAGGRLSVGDKIIVLDQNDGENHLHGGRNGLSDLEWKVASANREQIEFLCTRSPEEDGYPGNRCFRVRYGLDETALTIRLTVESDVPTVVNPSNHLYWNLSGDFSRDVGEHQLTIAADEVYYNDKNHLMERRWPVRQTVFDFRKPRELGLGRSSGDPQVQIAKGYNQLFVFNGNEPNAVLYHAQSGRGLRMTTSAPAMVLYEGGYLEGVTEDGQPIAPSGAVAMEPQRLPPDSHTPLTDANHPYELWIRYEWFVL